MQPDRRAVLSGLTASLIASPSLAATPRVRRSIATAEGQVDLEKYARGVELMMALPASDPRSWTFWWYIHSVRRDRTKQQEISRLYPLPSPTRDLAMATWSTCKGHSPGDNQDHFLPWHRLYLLQFEATMRQLLNDSEFALPYWNYIDPAQRALPAAFRRAGDPAWRSLYRPDRRDHANVGDRIDRFDAVSSLNAAALSEPTYRSRGPNLGFCRHIDRNLHGSVHVNIGNDRGMGDVPWAANDPIFWLHHCSIDRMWASWNRNGGRNPEDAWTNDSFVFPDGARGRVDRKVGDALDLANSDYVYDTLQEGPTITAAASGAPERYVIPVARSVAPIRLEGDQDIILDVLPRKGGIAAASGRRRYILLGDLSAQLAPGVLFEILIQDGKGAWQHVGALNFFGSVAMEGMFHGASNKAASADHDHDAAPTPAPADGVPAPFDLAADRTFSFDVTDLVRATGKIPPLRIRPVGAPMRSAVAVVGRVELVES